VTNAISASDSRPRHAPTNIIPTPRASDRSGMFGILIFELSCDNSRIVGNPEVMRLLPAFPLFKSSKVSARVALSSLWWPSIDPL
jgi:hypothetical protein